MSSNDILPLATQPLVKRTNNKAQTFIYPLVTFGAAVCTLTLIAIIFATPASAFQDNTRSTLDLKEMSIIPPTPIEPLDIPLFDFGSPDSLSEAQLLNRLVKLYDFQSGILRARAEKDPIEVDRLLAEAMNALGRLIQYDYLRSEDRVETVYRVLVSEYEYTYGRSDSMLVAVGEIYSFRADAFAALESVRDPLLEDVMSLDYQPIATEVPMPMNRLVESSISYLLKDPDKHLNHWLSRSDTYLAMVETIFAEVGIPDELKYLAMIESGLNPRARSWARAVGMWQFIAATGKHYGLEVNTWVDDRMDPEKSTRAAALHLKDLYAIYGDWHIAMAGYNCSPRCIKRAIRKAKADGNRVPTYWDMYPYLPRETRGYVPMFIAASLVASNPEAFNVPPVKPGPAYEYQQVPVRGMLSLTDLAGMANTDEATLKALNPNLRRGSLPPSTGVFYLRIPVGSYESFSAAYDALPEDAKKPSGEYIVRSGDTLGKIGGMYGVSVSKLMQRNSLTSTRIRIGQRLVVPVSDYSASLPGAPRAIADGTIIEYGRRSNRPIVSKREPAPVASATPIVTVSSKQASGPSKTQTPTDTGGKPRMVYTVRSGDTLAKIASRHDVSVRQIQSWNNKSGTRINVGERLALYTNTSPTSGGSGQSKTTYRVVSGDTLGEIAAKHGVTLSQLRQWNGIRGSRIRVGQRLNIYSGSSRSSVTYTIRSGDTLIGIAGKQGVTVSDLKSWNSLRSNTIKAGQQLTIFR